MSLAACAQIVRTSDPDRFLAAMTAPVAARKILFPLYALNVEISKAPWVTSEPILAEMRLQWWRDALDEIAGDGPVRRHEVIDSLGFLGADDVALLTGLINARRWDIARDPHEDNAALAEYIDQTAGTLTWVAARNLAAADTEEVVRNYAFAAGLARYLQAVPRLEALGRIPLVDGRADAVRALAAMALEQRPRGRMSRHLPPLARAALNETLFAKPVLRQVIRQPARVADGRIGLSETGKRLRLLAAGWLA